MPFPIPAAPFRVPTNSAQAFRFLHAVADTGRFVIVFSLIDSYLPGCGVVSQRGFVDLAFER